MRSLIPTEAERQQAMRDEEVALDEAARRVMLAAAGRIDEVRQVLNATYSPTAAECWLQTPLTILDERRPIDVLRNPNDPKGHLLVTALADLG